MVAKKLKLATLGEIQWMFLPFSYSIVFLNNIDKQRFQIEMIS